MSNDECQKLVIGHLDFDILFAPLEAGLLTGFGISH